MPANLSALEADFFSGFLDANNAQPGSTLIPILARACMAAGIRGVCVTLLTIVLSSTARWAFAFVLLRALTKNGVKSI